MKPKAAETTSIAKLEQIAATIPGAKLSKMFGCPCIKSPNGKASSLIWEEQLVVKPPKEHIEELLKSGYEMFTPMGGRSMNGWIVVPDNQMGRWSHFATEAYDWVSTLPSKK